MCTACQAQGDDRDEQQTRHFLSRPFSLWTRKNNQAFVRVEIFNKAKILTWTPFPSLLLWIFNHLTVPSFCLPWSSRCLWCYWKTLGSSEVQTSAFYCCLAWLKPHPPTLSPSPFTALNGLPFAKWFALGDQQMRRSPWELQAHLIEQKTRVFKTSLDWITYPSVLFWSTDSRAATRSKPCLMHLYFLSYCFWSRSFKWMCFP